MLPFGTGNDGAQVFDWGASPENELWLQDLESLMRDIITSQTESLSLWNAIVDGEVYDPNGERVNNQILLTYYFNMGVDAVVGMAVERNRTKRRCCNYIIYALKGIYEMVWRNQDHKMEEQVKRVVTNKKTLGGGEAEKVVADMSKLRSSPLNLVGTNLTQGYGGFLRRDAWHNSKEKLMDPGKALRKKGVSVIETSCDENESMLEQKYDDDKMELMCHEGLTDYVDFELARYG